jgi:hypothetical protein
MIAALAAGCEERGGPSAGELDAKTAPGAADAGRLGAGEPDCKLGARRCRDNTPQECTEVARNNDGTTHTWTALSECSGDLSACMAGKCQAAVVQVAAGGSFTCALRSTGQVKCWGENYTGELGVGDTDFRGDESGEMGEALPPVDLGRGRKAVAIAVNANASCAILDTGELKCWGAGHGDEPGEMGEKLPAMDLGLGRKATAVAMGFFAMSVLLDSGEVRSGVPYGTRALDSWEASVPVNLGMGPAPVEITEGGVHRCALFADSSLKCWGNNLAGALGLGDTEDRDTPEELGDALPAVDLGTGRHAVQVSACTYSTCAVLDDGDAKCWGLDSRDIVGDEPGEMGDALPALTLFGHARRIETSRVTFPGSHGVPVPCWACAVLETGEVQCLPSSLRWDVGPPVVDLGVESKAISLSVGESHACAILDSGQLKCWGSNDAGHLGLGDTEDRGDDPDEMGENLPEVDLGEG